ncbi:MAG: hypothetical protein LKF75_03260 [Bacilli bacterium]|jgi:hypothetical protein|nr:hypothetical protein [Bacilli bacterium]MCH4228701.1 hypothetical protein [Bacilli bacterium]MCH4278121.1 hypothetical protein [Bacilli bacterium]
MPHFEEATCPHCGKTAYGRAEIEEEFGYRYDGTIPQSWCRECRAAAGRSDDDDDESFDSGETLSVEDAAQIWLSNGKDEDYMFGYTEEELENALK